MINNLNSDLDFGLDELLDDDIYGMYIGTVVSDADSLGRVKVMIPVLFEGLTEDQLPWISKPDITMDKPPKGSTVRVVFTDGIYSGLYEGTQMVNQVTLDEESRLPLTDLGKQWLIDFEKLVIYGDYEGNNFTIKSLSLGAMIEITEDGIKIKSDSPIKLSGSQVILQKGLGKMLNEMTPCQFTGQLHVSTIDDIFG